MSNANRNSINELMATACVVRAIRLYALQKTTFERFADAQIALLKELELPAIVLDEAKVRLHLKQLWDDFVPIVAQSKQGQKFFRIPVAGLCPDTDAHGAAREEAERWKAQNKRRLQGRQ